MTLENEIDMSEMEYSAEIDLADLLNNIKDVPPSPGAKATNKQVLEYLRTLFPGLTKSIKRYKQETDTKIENLTKKGICNEENVNKQSE